MRYATLLVNLWLILPGGACTQGAEPAELSRSLRQIVVEAGQTVGDVQCSGCSVVVRGNAEGDVIALGGDVTVEGTVKGDAIALGGSVHLLPGSQLHGDAAAIGGSVQVDAGARAEGDSDSLPYVHVPGQRSLRLPNVSSLLITDLTLLLLGALIFRRRRAENLAGALIRHPWAVVLAGFLLMCVALLLFILSGIPRRYELLWISLIVLGILFTGLAGYLGVCQAIGRLAARRAGGVIGPLAGAVLSTALLVIPVAGFGFFLVLAVTVLGSALVSGLGTSPDWLPALLGQRASK
jgi:hypothetical protein